MKIRPQALFLSVVPLVFLAALLVVAGILQREIEQTTVWSHRSNDALEASARVAQGLDQANRALIAYTRRRTPESLASARRGMDLIKRSSDDMSRLAEPQQLALVRKFSAETNALLAIIRDYADDIQNGRRKAATALVARASTRKTAADWQATRAAFEQAERIVAIARFDALRRDVARLGATMLALAIAGIILTVFVTARFGWRMAGRLERLADNARRLGAGESPPVIAGSDEVAELDAVYHDMTRRLTKTLHEREEALAAYQREHDVASTLQRALLPQTLPRVAGLRIDTAYQPASQNTEVGGDWYDVFQVGERIVGISVGDVAGHGLRAASIMGSVRQSIRTAARDSDEPSAILRQVNAVLCADEGNAVVTAFFALLDLRDGTLRYAMAGHPPPLVLRPDGTVHLLEGAGFVLGVDDRVAFGDYTCTLDTGDGLVLYTDGVVEVERDYFKGMEDLKAAAVAEYARPSANVAEAIHARIFAKAGARDDSAILYVAVQSLGALPVPRGRQHWTVDARDANAVYRVRRAMLRQIGGFMPVPDELAAVEAIFGELVGNVARHTPGPADISVEHDDGALLLNVEDSGPPFALNGHALPDVFAESGRGMFLVRSLARDVTLSRTGSGNRVSVVLPMQTH